MEIKIDITKPVPVKLDYNLNEIENSFINRCAEELNLQSMCNSCMNKEGCGYGYTLVFKNGDMVQSCRRYVEISPLTLAAKRYENNE